jgi:hypothetical protein
MTCLIPVHSPAGRQASRSFPSSSSRSARDVAQRQPSSLPGETRHCHAGPTRSFRKTPRSLFLGSCRARGVRVQTGSGRAGRTRGPSSSACGRTRTVGVGDFAVHHAVHALGKSMRAADLFFLLLSIPLFR